MKEEQMSEVKLNTQHKDRLFKRVFAKKKDLLSLYNAVNGTDYSNPEEIEINTIENFIYMGMKNDVSFLIAHAMNLYEQQSSVNPNMPLRGFLYLAELYRKLFGNHTDLYSSKLIPLPMPQFIVFYNGEEDEPDRRIMRMSEAYEGTAVNEPAIECNAVLLNINYGHNKELMQKCKRLEGYSILIAKIRVWISKGKPKEEAVNLAVDECIRENILADILEKHKAEATTMILEEYNEELHIKNEKEISFEDGFRQGTDQERSGLVSAIHRLKAGESPEAIISSGISSETVEAALSCID